MNKRGISPLIASVFLIGLAIVVGSVVFFWGFDVKDTTFSLADEWIDSAEFIKFSAKWPNSANCTEIYDVSGAKCPGNVYYCILIENGENRNMNYLVKTKGSLGTEICSPENFELTPFQSKIFAVGFDDSIVGVDVISEVDAVLKR